MKQILVCGGAGYIGSHMVRRLLGEGVEATVFDNLSTGHRESVDGVALVVGDIMDQGALTRLFKANHFDAVMHFCARSLVAESMREPYAYYRNNLAGTLNLVDAMRAAGVERLIFSSTAAVYGNPIRTPIDESHPVAPINPYGASKLAVERMLRDAADAYGLRSVALRYFNAAGADPSGEIGESHQPESHLIPNVLRAALGKGAGLKVFGTDYETADGTCVRDYVHVSDLADAHLRALDYLDGHPGAHVFNLGHGSGYSVLEVVEVARRITGRPIPCEFVARRPGDPPVLVASNARALKELGWRPTSSGLDQIIEAAWRWHCSPRY